MKIWRPRQVRILLFPYHPSPYDDRRSMSALVNVTTSPWRSVYRLKATGRPHLWSCTRGEMFLEFAAWIVTLTTDLFLFQHHEEDDAGGFQGQSQAMRRPLSV